MKIDDSVGVFTVCNLGYLNKAIVLAESVYTTNNLKTSIYLFDKKTNLKLDKNFIEIIWIEDCAPKNFNHLAFMYNVIELTTALKPYLATLMVKKYSKVIFFDPDIMVFEKLDIVFENLNNYDFLLTPHQSSIEYNPLKNLNYQRFGYFNLGFFAFNKSNISKKILEWWWDQCKRYCFDESHYGSFTDQKWMSLAPFYFSEIKSLNNPQLNVAWWNLHERTIAKNSLKNKFTIENKNIVFFHFSAFGSEKKLTNRMYNSGHNSKKCLNQLASLYQQSLNKNRIFENTRIYSFDYFDNGEYINPLVRRAYASKIETFENTIINPFSKPKSLSKFINSNYLKSRSKINYSHIGHKDKIKYSTYLNLYFKILRLVLFIIGPNRFIALNRLMIYSSSLINNKELWKNFNK